MKRICVLVIVSGTLPGCASLAGLEPGKTPEATFKNFQKALTLQDFGALYGMFSRGSKEDFRQYIEEMKGPVRLELESRGMDVDQLRAQPPNLAFIRISRRYAELNPEEYRQMARAVVLGTADVYGSRSTVHCQLPNGSTHMFHLVRENGLWRLDDFLN